jgi:large subunit ribosomal protein L9
MKVILTQTVPKVGKQGQVVKVAGGYARNYLFPRGLATVADKKQIAVLERKNAVLASQDAKTLDGAKALREKLDGQLVKIEGKAGHETTRLFGAVTSQHIADAIKEQLKVEIDKRKIALIDPLKRLGKHAVHLDLHREVDAVITVQVFDPSMPIEEEAATEIAADAAATLSQEPVVSSAEAEASGESASKRKSKEKKPTPDVRVDAEGDGQGTTAEPVQLG